MRKILMIFIMLTLLVPALCFAGNDSTGGIINHVMATKIEYHQGFITGPTNRLKGMVLSSRIFGFRRYT